MLLLKNLAAKTKPEFLLYIDYIRAKKNVTALFHYSRQKKSVNKTTLFSASIF